MVFGHGGSWWTRDLYSSLPRVGIGPERVIIHHLFISDIFSAAGASFVPVHMLKFPEMMSRQLTT